MAISAQNQRTSIEFMRIMNALMEIVEQMAENSPESKYLDAMNLFRDLYKERENAPRNPTIVNIIHQVVQENPVVQQHDRRTRMKISKPRCLTDVEKLELGWKICGDCGRLIAKGYMTAHKSMDVCGRTFEQKQLSKNTQQDDTTRIFECVQRIKGALRKVGRDSWFSRRRDTGYYMKGTYEERQAAEE